jgi:hypothetical protein
MLSPHREAKPGVTSFGRENTSGAWYSRGTTTEHRHRSAVEGYFGYPGSIPGGLLTGAASHFGGKN